MKLRKYLVWRNYVFAFEKYFSRYHDYLKDREFILEFRNKYTKAGLLNKQNLTRGFLRETQHYWVDHYGAPIDLTWHIAIANFTGKEDCRYIPNNLWFTDILPCFNQMSMRPAYLDKNLSDVFLNTNIRKPGTIIKRMHGNYYHEDHSSIKRAEAINAVRYANTDMIIKSSQTDNGVGVRNLCVVNGEMFLSDKKVEFSKLESIYGKDFIVQSRVRQHPVLSEPHPDSLNTIRVVTFRYDEVIRILHTEARFGADGKITDNGATGGVACGIDTEGRLFPKCIDHALANVQFHPTTGYSFEKQAQIPSYPEICRHAISMHKQIFHFNIISWDFAIDEEGSPVFIEVNYRGASWRWQFLSGQPLFGELTTDILHILKENRHNKRI